MALTSTHEGEPAATLTAVESAHAGHLPALQPVRPWLALARFAYPEN